VAPPTRRRPVQSRIGLIGVTHGCVVIYLLALLPATVLTIAGYFVLYLSSRTEGTLRTFGKYLAFWAFTLAGLVIIGALFAAAHGGHRAAMYGMHGRDGGMYCPWEDGARMDERGGPRGDDRRPPLPAPAEAPAESSPPPAR
jgi:hypothetical protein